MNSAVDVDEIAERKARRMAARAAIKERRQHELQGSLRLEIVKIVARTERPPSLAGKTAPNLAPLGPGEAWLPKVPRWNKEKQVREMVAPENPRVALFRVLELIQGRIADVGNLLIAKLWTARQLGKYAEAKDKAKAANAVNSYQVVRQVWQHEAEVPVITGGTASLLGHNIQQLCVNYWKKTRSRALVPSLDNGWPIWVRKDGWRITRNDGLNIAFSIDGTWWEIGLRVPRRNKRKASADPYAMSILRRLVAGEPHWDANDAPTALQWRRTTLGLYQKGGKWFALMQYRQPKPQPLSVPNKVVVHCGLKFFAVAMDLETALKRGGGLWVDGTDLNNMRARFRFRVRDLQLARKLRPHGHGHMAQVYDLRAKGEDWTKHWVRRVARRIVELAEKTRSAIYFMDLKDIRRRVEASESDLPGHIRVRVHQAPWFLLRTYVEQGAAAAGLPFHTYAPRYHTQRCPHCGNKSAANPNYKKWLFVCGECGHTGHLDRIGVENAFIDLGHAAEIQLPPDSDYARAARRIEEDRELAKLAGLDKAPREQPGGEAKKDRKVGHFRRPGRRRR